MVHPKSKTLEQMQQESRLRYSGMPPVHVPPPKRRKPKPKLKPRKEAVIEPQGVDFEKVGQFAAKTPITPIKYKRPLAVFNQILSPFGIASELLFDQMKKSAE